MRETMKKHARGVLHVGFTVSDLSRSCEFYSALGFREVSRFHAGGPEQSVGTGVPGTEVDIINLEYDNVILELVQYTVAGNAAPPRNNDVGAAHFCLRVDDLTGLYAALHEKGVDSYSAPHRDANGSYWVYMRDPDGITVELQQPGPGL
jgi:catechol 2,3-dioxygenase-like lactoylglutathione lyase family enzyme